MWITSFLAILSITGIFLFTSCNTVLANDLRNDIDIGQSRIHPASLFYFLKAIRENIELKFALTSRVKMLREMEFAIRRLREVNALVTINQDLIQPTLESYNAHIKIIPDIDLDDTEISVMTKNNLVVHLKVLRHVYDKASNLKAKMAIRSAMNRIIQRSDVPVFAKVPVCNFFIKEATSSSLNQTEKFVLQSRAQKCFFSLKSLNL